jgi:hypothetical protein
MFPANLIIVRSIAVAWNVVATAELEVGEADEVNSG